MSERTPRTYFGMSPMGVVTIVFILLGSLGGGIAIGLLIDRNDELVVQRDDAETEQAVTETAAASLLDQIDDECSTTTPQDRTARQQRLCEAADEVAETITGAAGPPGPPGPAGADGATGATGPRGEQGPRGPRGFIGPVGVDGLDGLSGVDGATGATGPQGPPGPAGADGQDGTDGKDGAAGADGRDGTAIPGTYTCPEPDTQRLVGITFTPEGDVELDCRPARDPAFP